MGLEWAAILIPAIAGVALHYAYKHKVVWYEVIMPMLPALILIPLIKLLAVTSLTTDYERHGGWAVEARHYEHWNEYIHQTCTRTTGSGKDAKTETYDCSYVQDHPEYWELEDSNGYVMQISASEFEGLCNRFGNKTFREMHRHYHTIDGDEYHTVWGGNEASLQPIATHHTYENRVQATHGVIDFPEVTKKEAKEKGLYDFPQLTSYLYDPAILGSCAGSLEADAYLQIQNGKLGRRKQVRFWLLIFHNKPREVGFDQESYWVGGNKNEVVVTVGLDSSNQVMWCHPFCWSPDGNTSNDVMKINIRNHVEAQKDFKPLEAAQFIVAEATEKFERKHFKEFSYLTVDTPTWAYWVIYIMTILSTIGMGIFIVGNEIDENNSLGEWIQDKVKSMQ